MTVGMKGGDMSGRQKDEREGLVRFRDLIPGILSLVGRLPSAVRGIRAALSVKDEDNYSLGRVLEENAEIHPDRKAILYEDRSLTHAELNAAVNQHAHYFLSLGVKRGDPVIVFVENRPELLIIIGALAKIGAISSLINTNQRDEVLTHSITQTKERVFVIGEELVEAFEAVRGNLDLSGGERIHFVPDKGPRTANEGYIDLPDATKHQSTDNPATTTEIQIKDPICYVFTSGTTGMPKAAILGNRRWIAALHGFGRLLMNLKSHDVLYCSLPLYHTTALCVGWPTAAANGAALAIRRKFSVSNFWSDAKKFNATAFVYIGELCRYLLNQPPSPDDAKNPMKKIVGNGLRPDIWMQFKRRFAVKQITELYGATEFGFAFINLFNIDNTVGMCLTPFAIVEFDLDEEMPLRGQDGFMKRVKRGESGLLIGEISEKVPFHGYTDKKATESKILHDVFEKGDQWLDTGDFVQDLGYKHIQFADRLGDTFRWKGENVSTTQVEEAISSLPQVTQAAVYGVKIPGTDGRAGMAAIIPSVPAEEFDLSALSQALHRSLPLYAVPKFLRFMDEFEITPTFKVKKSVLRNESYDHALDDAPTFALLPGEQEYVPLTAGLLKEINDGEYRY